MRAKKPLRLATLSLIAALVAITWATQAREVFRALQAYSVAKETIRVNAEVDALLQAGQNLAFERGRTNLLLRARGTPSPENWAFIDARRAAVSNNLDRILSNPYMYDLPLFNRIRSEYSALTSLRATVDSALSREHAERPSGLAARWLSETTTLIGDLAELSSSISLMSDRYSVSFRAMSRLKILAFDLRNALGIEAARIAAAAQSSVPTNDAEMSRLYSLRGEGNAIWTLLRRESGITGNAVAGQAIETIAREFFGTFRPVQDEALGILIARRTGRAREIDVGRLTAASVPALDSIAQALSDFTAESARISQRQHDRAQEDFVRAVLSATFAFVTGLLALLLIRFRLLSPLDEIGSELGRLAGGDLSLRELRHHRNDELSKGYEAIKEFRASLIKRKELEDRLTELSNIDGLTSIANRRRLDSTLAEEWNRAERAGTSLAVVMIDVDLFKNFNDRYGHLAGDECLKAIARSLGEMVRRPGDLAARFGGEEFMAVLPGFDVIEAESWANRLRESVIARAIVHEDSPSGYVTVSGGVAALRPSRGGSCADLVEMADKALYAAKESGRNRVMTAVTTGEARG